MPVPTQVAAPPAEPPSRSDGWFPAELSEAFLFVGTQWYQDNYCHSTGDDVSIEVSTEGDDTTITRVGVKDVQSGIDVALRCRFSLGRVQEASVAIFPFSDVRPVWGRKPTTTKIVEARVVQALQVGSKPATPMLLFFVVTEQGSGTRQHLMGQVRLATPN